MTTTTDQLQRYTAERIASMSDLELHTHLDERRLQRDRVKRDMTRCHEQLERLEDPDGSAYSDALASLGSYTREHATMNRIIRHLEGEEEKRRLDALAAFTADGRRPIIELVDNAIAQRGMPCGVEEAGDLETAHALWMAATLAIENEHETYVTQGAVADRVADAYAVIYGYASATRGIDLKITIGDARNMAEFLRPAAQESRRENPADWPHRVVDQLDKATGHQ